MAKNTKALSGPAAQKYIRELLRSDPGVTADATERLTATCGQEIAQLRVRLPIPVRSKPQPVAATVVAAPVAAVAPAKPAVFDPFAFSVVVVWTKQGADGLLAKLAGIDDPANLKAIAKAQHIAVPATAQSVEDLRQAIVTGTAARIADRQAASG
jgi:hypothetical protein